MISSRNKINLLQSNRKSVDVAWYKSEKTVCNTKHQSRGYHKVLEFIFILQYEFYVSLDIFYLNVLCYDTKRIIRK